MDLVLQVYRSWCFLSLSYSVSVLAHTSDCLHCLLWHVMDKVGWALGCSLAAFGVTTGRFTSSGRQHRAPTRNTPNCSRSRVEQEGLTLKHLQFRDMIHLGKLTWKSNMKVDGRWFSFSNGWCLGSSRSFSGVYMMCCLALLGSREMPNQCDQQHLFTRMHVSIVSKDLVICLFFLWCSYGSKTMGFITMKNHHHLGEEFLSLFPGILSKSRKTNIRLENIVFFHPVAEVRILTLVTKSEL